MNPALGKRLRKLRTESDLSQKELGAPRYTHAHISSIENGKRAPSQDALQHFASKLGIDVEELVTGRPADLVENLELRIQQGRQLLSSGRIDEASAAYEKLGRESRDWGLEREVARVAHGLALCDERRGHWERAIDRYEEAEVLTEGRFSDIHADIVAGKARCFEALGDRSHAIYLLDRAIRDLKRRGLEDPLTLVKLYAPLAYSACEAGFYTQAGEAASAALALEPTIDDPLSLGVTHINVARVLLQQGERQAALRSLHKAADLFDQLDLKLELGRARLAHGLTLAHGGETAAATKPLTQALAVFKEVGSELDQARALVELGRVERLAGDASKAELALESAIDLLGRTECVAELALAHRELGLALQRTEPERAEKNLREAAALYERVEASLQAALTYRHIGELLEKAGADASAAFRDSALSIPLKV